MIADLGRPKDPWWRFSRPRERKRCYPIKRDALRVFLDANRRLVDHYGGPDQRESPAEFDAINHRYGLRGRRAVRTIADAVWEAMPAGAPYCVDAIDIEALNDTSPAREARTSLGVEFQLPEEAFQRTRREQASRRRRERAAWLTQKRTIADDCFRTKTGKEVCVCRDATGAFARCHYDPEVPF